MNRLAKVIAVAACALVVSAVAGLIMVVAAKHTGDIYKAQLKLAFNAATLNYAPGDAATTVRVELDGREYEINPDNYRVINFYLSRAPLRSYLPLGGSARMTVTFCGEDTARVYRVSADKAVVVMDIAGKRAKVRISEDNLWEKLESVIINGHTDSQNIAL